MKFSVYSVGMPEFDIKESVAIAKKYGYDGIEWRVAPIPEKEPESYPFERRYWAWNKSTLDEKNIIEDALKAKAYCDEAGIEIYGLATALGVNQTELVTNAIIAAGKIGCPIIRAGLVGYDPYKAEKPYNELLKDTKAKLLEYLPLLKENNVKIVLETHHGTMIASASAAYRALEGLDPTYYGVIFDPGNMVGEGFEDYRKGFDILGPYLAHVHIKNSALEYAGDDELGSAIYRSVQKPLNKGAADLKKLFIALRDAGYEGVVSTEDFSNDVSTEEKLAFNIDYLKKLYEAAKK